MQHLADSSAAQTETDKECEKLIFGRLKEAFPDHAFIGEEESSAQGFTTGLTPDPTWMVDPVDGVLLPGVSGKKSWGTCRASELSNAAQPLQ